MRNQLSLHIDKWYEIGSSSTIINWLEEGVRFPIENPIEAFEIPNKSFSQTESAFIKKELQTLLLLGHIELCTEKPYCVSPINCVPKKKGDFRLITDLRYINNKGTPPTFKNEDINTVIDLVKPKDYIVTADLKNVFFPRACTR